MDINLNKIFSTFDDEDGKDLNKRFLNNFIYTNLQKYIHYIINYKLLDLLSNKFDILKELNNNKIFDPKKGELIFYNKSYNHLLKIHEISEEEGVLDIFAGYMTEEFLVASKIILKYFEEQELYEYCSVINKYILLYNEKNLKKDLAW